MALLADKIIVLPERGHDWLDHVWGWSQVGGAIVAIVALIVALRSVRGARAAADASERSATAAERTAVAAEATAATAQEELEMLKKEASRRARLVVTPTTLPSEAPRSMILQLGLFNEGDADAPRAVLNILVPRGSRVWQVANVTGAREREAVMHPTSEELPGSGEAVFVVGHLDAPVNIPTVSHFRVEFPSAGDHPVRLRLSHSLADTVTLDFEAEVS